MSVRTLIVDDAPTARTILRHYLSGIGCEIIGEADNSAAADDLMASAAPDLVTLDIHMPEIRGMDSYSLFRKIRKNQPKVEFVVISGATFFQNRRDFLKGGAIGYFAKPIDFRGLLTDLRAVFPELGLYRPKAATL
ncbi:MAG: two-component system, chemotaxis family, chemotaxis protein CheY [Candidatus Binataceae bacterium]|jgi:DNA-binding NarL/FixJ family response regulator|nr:two-component system, chemotaxis family, chemotaxis protein CheY [Candidatus Binataceae bacterium]